MLKVVQAKFYLYQKFLKNKFNLNPKNKYVNFFKTSREIMEQNRKIQEIFYDFNLNLLTIFYQDFSLTSSFDKLTKDKFPESNINESINPDEVVAYGAVIYSESLKRNSGDFWENFDYLDSTEHSYGVETEDGTMEVIIPRGSHYPTSEHKYFFNAYDDQYTFVIRVFEGENLYVDDNHLLGEFTLRDIPKKKKGELILDVIFTIDTDQILNVTGYVSEGNIKTSIKIDKKNPLSNDPNSKLILGNISINGDDFSKEEKRLKLEIFNYSKNFKKMKNDKFNELDKKEQRNE